MKKIRWCLLFTFILVCGGCSTVKSNVEETSNLMMSKNAGEIKAGLVEEEKSFPKGSDQEFTLVGIPDTQGYSDYYAQIGRKKNFPCNQYEFNNRQMQFIAKNSVKNGGDFACAIHLGDFVNEGSWFKYEWKKADEALSYLDGEIPLISVIGNHDYDNHYLRVAGVAKWLKGSKMFNKYFGAKSKYYKDKEWYGGSSKNGLNNWIIFNGAGRDFLVIGLEVEPSDEILEWAQEVIDSHPDLPVIVATHVYLGLEKESKKSNNARMLKKEYKENGNSPEEVHNKFILKNKNIFLVLCAHCFSGDRGESMRTDVNEYNYPVYTLLSDYQARSHLITDFYPEYTGELRYCGDGWLRLMQFDFESKQIHVQTYSTEYNKFETDEDSDFFLPIDWNWEERFGS